MDSLFEGALKDEEASKRARCWFGQGRDNNDTVEPLILCEHCQKVCNQSKLLPWLPEIYETGHLVKGRRTLLHLLRRSAIAQAVLSWKSSQLEVAISAH
jgi:hypothetical protein